jgi:hypothetical protein
MEFNKEEFTRAILKFFTFPLDAFSSKEEYDEIKLSNRDEVWEISNYIPECIDFLYLNNELLVLKNSKLILEKNLEKLKRDIEKIDDTLIIETTNVKIKHVEDFISKIESSIETQETLDSPHLNEDKSSKRPLTEHQVAIFFYYIFHELNVNSTTDNTKITDIILKLIGKSVELKKVRNTNMYKIYSNLLGHNKDKKNLRSNLMIVKDIYETLHIDTKEIVLKINKL